MHHSFRRPLLCGLLVLAGAAHAQSAREDDPAQRAVQKAQALLKQVAAEKAALEQRTAELEGQVQALERTVRSAEGELEQTGARLERTLADKEALARELTGTRVSLEQTRGTLESTAERLEDTTRTLRRTQAEKQRLVLETDATIEHQTGELLACEAKNVALYEANQELMAAYENKDALDALLQRERFTGLKQVQVENLLQEYRFKVEDQSYERPTIDKPESLLRELRALQQGTAQPDGGEAGQEEAAAPQGAGVD